MFLLIGSTESHVMYATRANADAERQVRSLDYADLGAGTSWAYLEDDRFVPLVRVLSCFPEAQHLGEHSRCWFQAPSSNGDPLQSTDAPLPRRRTLLPGNAGLGTLAILSHSIVNQLQSLSLGVGESKHGPVSSLP